jgi:hypothetical protein
MDSGITGAAECSRLSPFPVDRLAIVALEKDSPSYALGFLARASSQSGICWSTDRHLCLMGWREHVNKSNKSMQNCFG